MIEASLRIVIREICREAQYSRVWIAGDAISAVAPDGRTRFFLRAAGESWSAFSGRIGAELTHRQPMRRVA
jgi:hypothetical protein